MSLHTGREERSKHHAVSIRTSWGCLSLLPILPASPGCCLLPIKLRTACSCRDFTLQDAQSHPKQAQMFSPLARTWLIPVGFYLARIQWKLPTGQVLHPPSPPPTPPTFSMCQTRVCIPTLPCPSPVPPASHTCVVQDGPSPGINLQQNSSEAHLLTSVRS